MPRLTLSRLAVPGAVLLALIVVFAVAWATRPGSAQVPAAGSQTAAVTAVTRSCPPAAPGSSAARIAAIALPGQAAGGQGAPKAGSGTPAGLARFAAVPSAAAAAQAGSTTKGSTAKGSAAKEAPAKGAAGAQPATVSAPGTVATVTTAGSGGTAVDATGAMAEGFEAEQADASGTGLVSCTHPGSDMWFVGTGEAAGATKTSLFLVNTGTVMASADITILTDTGQQAGLSTAVSVLPNQSVTKDISPYVHGSQAIALHVQSTVGQVAAAAWEGGSSGGAWLPQAAAPSTSLIIPGLTVASHSAQLFVVVPGSTDAQLKVTAYTPSGAVPQFPGSQVDASAGAATPFALNSLGASAAGLRVTSTVPVVAGVLVPGAGLGSFTTAVAPVTEQGVVAGNPAARGVTVGLLFTAPGAAARASVAVVSPDGTVTRAAADQSVAVAAGHTVALAVPRPGGSDQPFAVVVTPAAGSGPLYAVRVVTSGSGGLSAPLTSLLPVSSALTSIQLPPARDSYQAVLP